MKVTHVAGARPNYMKVAPVMSALDRYGGVNQVLVHTGQHYDDNMSGLFFGQLGLQKPDVNLGVGSGSHIGQIAAIMTRMEAVVVKQRPDIVVVYGDVNSTVAAALVCAKSHIPLAHVEAGLRSFDMSMPEEANRLLTDRLADLLFTPSADATENLKNEGVYQEKIHFVGNVMVDTLISFLPKTDEGRTLEDYGLKPRCYGLVTLHRPSNVDETGTLSLIMEALQRVSRDIAIVFPVHPRTRVRINELNVGMNDGKGCRLMDPVGYLEFLELQRNAQFVITDSGGVQEETTYLGVPCLTVRQNTERPVTVTIGTNTLVGHDMARLMNEIENIRGGKAKSGIVPPLWDGKTGERIASIIAG